MKTKPVIIHVKQEHIDRGKCMKPAACAVAIGLEEAVPLAEFLVEPGAVWIRSSFSEESWYDHNQIKLPIEATRFIRAFDDSKRPPPISFTLDIPECFLPAEPERSKVVEPRQDLQSVET